MDLYFNSLLVPKVINYSAERKTRKTNVEYNANGDMLIDMVNRKYTLTVYLGQLTGNELSAVLQQTENPFFSVSFFSALSGSIQRIFHLQSYEEEVSFVYNGRTYYKAIKLVLEEK